jgi:hypothetical protein
MQTELKYFVRDKQGRATNTKLPVTPEIILSGVQYREVVAIRRAIAYNLRRQGLTCKRIGAILNKSESTIEYGLDKVDFGLVEAVKGIEL